MIKLLAFIAFANVAALAQGTIYFAPRPDGAHAVPPNASSQTAWGEIGLGEDNRLLGYIRAEGLGFGLSVTSVGVFESSDSGVLGTMRWEFELGDIGFPDPEGGDPGSRYFNLDARISAEDRVSLLAGNWYVNMATPTYPDGELRAQLIPIPEPQTLALAAIGGCALLLVRRRRVGCST